MTAQTKISTLPKCNVSLRQKPGNETKLFQAVSLKPLISLGVKQGETGGVSYLSV
jgi:hypothetical protein